MPREGVVLFSEPIGHGLEYSSCFFKRIAESARGIGVSVVESGGFPDDLDSKIDEHDPAVFYSVGHGQHCIHTVANLIPYIEVEHPADPKWGYPCYENLRLDKFKGRHVHLLSCITAVHLGPALIDHGCRSFIGYDAEFVYGVWIIGAERPAPCEEPKPDADFYSFVDCDAEGERKIVLEGSTVGEAVNAMIAKFEEYIKKYEEGEWKDRPIAPWAARWLRHDLDHLKAYGDMDWRPVPIVAPLPYVAMGGIAMGLLALSAIATYAHEKGWWKLPWE